MCFGMEMWSGVPHVMLCDRWVGWLLPIEAWDWLSELAIGSVDVGFSSGIPPILNASVGLRVSPESASLGDIDMLGDGMEVFRIE